MSLTDWLVRCFWKGLGIWINRDPATAEQRLSAIFAEAIERVVAAQEREAAKAAQSDPQQPA